MFCEQEVSSKIYWHARELEIPQDIRVEAQQLIYLGKQEAKDKVLKRQEREESRGPYADMLTVRFLGWGSFLLTLLLGLVSVCTYKDLLLLNGHFCLLLHLNFHPTFAPAHSHVLVSVLENGNILKSLSPTQCV